MQIGYSVPQRPARSDLNNAERKLAIAHASLLGTKLMYHLCMKEAWQGCGKYRLDRDFTPGILPWRAPAEVRVYRLPRPARRRWATSPGLGENGVFYELSPLFVLETYSRRVDGPYPLGWHEYPELMIELLSAALHQLDLPTS